MDDEKDELDEVNGVGAEEALNDCGPKPLDGRQKTYLLVFFVLFIMIFGYVLFNWLTLTGDYTVVRTLERGANTMRDFLCPGRWDAAGPVCAPDHPREDYWAGLTGRTAVQWYEVFLFVGMIFIQSSIKKYSL